MEATGQAYAKAMATVDGLMPLVRKLHSYLDAEEQALWGEFVLHALAEHSRIGRTVLAGKASFGDLMASMLQGDTEA